MPWVRIDEKAMEHPKVAGLHDGAFRLWVQGLAHCQKFLTDGLIDRVSLRGLRAYSPKRAQELVGARLWLAAEAEGVTVHDYLQWNDSREHVLRVREQGKERVRRLRGKGNAVTPCEQSANDLRSYSGDVSCSPKNPIAVIEGERGTGGGRGQAFAGHVLRVPRFLDEDFVAQLNGQDFDLSGFYLALDSRLAQTGESWDLRWIREQFAAESPKPERRKAERFEKPYTADERTKAERVRRNMWQNRCRHDPKCETAASCIAAIIDGWRSEAEHVA